MESAVPATTAAGLFATGRNGGGRGKGRHATGQVPLSCPFGFTLVIAIAVAVVAVGGRLGAHKEGTDTGRVALEREKQAADLAENKKVG